MFTKGCPRCGAFATTCPNHDDQLEAYSSELAVLGTFDNLPPEVLASKTRRGEKLISHYRIPNRKVWYERNGRAANVGDYEQRTFHYKGVSIILPVED